MPSWESVEKSYTDAIQAVFPLHRVFIFACGLLISIAINKQTHLSISESVANINISIFSEPSKLLKEFVVYDLIFGFFMVFFGWLFSRIILRCFLYLAARSSKIWEKINSKQPQFNFGEELKISERKEAVEWIDSMTNDVKLRIRNINFNSELFAGIGFGLLVAFHWGNVIDFLLFILLISISTYLSLKSISVFISDYLGPHSVKEIVQSGEVKKTMDGF